MIPELVDIGAKRKVLPHGRYACTLDEVEERYVPEGDANRKEIWNAFKKVLLAIQNFACPVAEVWVGGSFITSEAEPHDIDAIFFVQGQVVGNEISVTLHDNEFGAYVLNVLSQRVMDEKNPSCFKRLHPKVDGYLVFVPPTDVKGNISYSTTRGYWDQFWSKARFDDSDDNRWLYPAAGYLEVMVDGYEAQ